MINYNECYYCPWCVDHRQRNIGGKGGSSPKSESWGGEAEPLLHFCAVSHTCKHPWPAFAAQWNYPRKCYMYCSTLVINLVTSGATILFLWLYSYTAFLMCELYYSYQLINMSSWLFLNGIKLICMYKSQLQLLNSLSN